MFAKAAAALGLAMILALVGQLLTVPASAGAQVAGNSYTSPPFGYTVT